MLNVGTSAVFLRGDKHFIELCLTQLLFFHVSKTCVSQIYMYLFSVEYNLLVCPARILKIHHFSSYNGLN